jgi:type II restriction enzyme
MPETYTQTIARLISDAPFNIDTEIKIEGRPPSSASSEFLTNKEQGDWAERIVYSAINEHSPDFLAVQYGRADSLAAGDDGFSEFYQKYQRELNEIGKKPDLLIFRRAEFPDIDSIDLDDDNTVCRAVAAIEVRSSSFLANKYAAYMDKRSTTAIAECERLCRLILQEPLQNTLRNKSPEILSLIEHATGSTFRELDFRLRTWSSSPVLRELSDRLRELKEQIKILHKRDYLSITPKLEDLSLVSRWIQHFGVKHYYLQVFFDKAYVISFKEILEISSDPAKEDVIFSVEQDVKNQGKTTIKINVQVGREILGRIDMPQHKAALKELERGRLLFYVTFQGGRGYLDPSVFLQEIINDV